MPGVNVGSGSSSINNSQISSPTATVNEVEVDSSQVHVPEQPKPKRGSRIMRFLFGDEGKEVASSDGSSDNYYNEAMKGARGERLKELEARKAELEADKAQEEARRDALAKGEEPVDESGAAEGAGDKSQPLENEVHQRYAKFQEDIRKYQVRDAFINTLGLSAEEADKRMAFIAKSYEPEAGTERSTVAFYDSLLPKHNEANGDPQVAPKIVGTFIGKAEKAYQEALSNPAAEEPEKPEASPATSEADKLYEGLKSEGHGGKLEAQRKEIASKLKGNWSPDMAEALLRQVYRDVGATGKSGQEAIKAANEAIDRLPRSIRPKKAQDIQVVQDAAEHEKGLYMAQAKAKLLKENADYYNASANRGEKDQLAEDDAVVYAAHKAGQGLPDAGHYLALSRGDLSDLGEYQEEVALGPYKVTTLTEDDRKDIAQEKFDKYWAGGGQQKAWRQIISEDPSLSGFDQKQAGLEQQVGQAEEDLRQLNTAEQLAKAAVKSAGSEDEKKLAEGNLTKVVIQQKAAVSKLKDLNKELKELKSKTTGRLETIKEEKYKEFLAKVPKQYKVRTRNEDRKEVETMIKDASTPKKSSKGDRGGEVAARDDQLDSNEASQEAQLAAQAEQARLQREVQASSDKIHQFQKEIETIDQEIAGLEKEARTEATEEKRLAQKENLERLKEERAHAHNLMLEQMRLQAQARNQRSNQMFASAMDLVKGNEGRGAKVLEGVMAGLGRVVQSGSLAAADLVKIGKQQQGMGRGRMG
ncbi:MAG: hypothetical protein KDK66_02170 [Deltaproteobacteria bacterium]|nr:hypothetical protein [Deltaproteobacteria bacterium]